MNPAEVALDLLHGERPRAWRWDDDGAIVGGVLQGTRRLPDKYRDGATVLVLDLLHPEAGRVSVYAGASLEKMVASHTPRVGDGIAIKRGPLVERENANNFRRWDVEVVHVDGALPWGEVEADV